MRRTVVFTISVLLTAALSMSLAQGVSADVSTGDTDVRSGGKSGAQPFVFLNGDAARGIPFRVVDQLIVVSARLNNSIPVDLFLDTGFGSKGLVLFDPQIGTELGLKYVAEVNLGGGGNEGGKKTKVATGVTLTFPGIRFDNQQVLVMSDNGSFSGLVADGIVGGTLFDCVVEIDYENRVLNLYREVPRRVVNTAERFELSFTQGMAVVEAQVTMDGKGTIPVKLIVETGAGLPLFLFPYSNPALTPPPKNITARNEGLNGTMTYTAGRVPELKVGSFILNRVLTAFLDKKAMGTAVALGQNGFLGHETLQMFNVFLDYPNGHMYLKPNKRYGKGFDLNMAGLVLKTRSDGRLAVFDVIADSPASLAGLRPGDVIVTVNGKDVTLFGADEVSTLFVQRGEKVRLKVVRDSKRMDFTLLLRRII